MLFKTDPSQIQRFLEDTSNIRTGSTPGVYFPQNADEVRDIVIDAQTTGKRLVIAGNATGTTGGRIPFGDYVISTEKLNHIGEIVETGNNLATLTAGAGVLLEDIQNKCLESGWFYPPDPTEKLCFIGSTIANNSSGARTLKYGPTRNHIARLKLLLSTGKILDLRRGEQYADASGTIRCNVPSGRTLEFDIARYSMPATSKHNAGYFSAPGMDLVDLFIGSEGTLGIILEAELVLRPAPEKIISFLIYFSTLDDLFSFVSRAKQGDYGVEPRALELFEKNALNFLRNIYPEIPLDTAGAIFLEQEATEQTEEMLLESWFELMESCNAMTDESWVALDTEEQRAMKAFRHELPVQVNEWLSHQAESKISTDMAVPEASFRELFDFYRNRCQERDFRYIIFGHAGNAHVHLNILPKNHEEYLEAKKLYLDLVDKALQLGGTLSAEHGIGKLKAEYLVKMFGREGILEMVRIKKYLDPFLMLNMGNLIPLEYYETC
ncbi:MAG: FAD-binding oxidoreductase [Prosthecochloris sp.]|uniref:FAD-binding oxidoreductase n=1 Tax=Prosthecochloris sp. TaxID=290513 RepID=UPI0013C8ECE9|nr:FAD-binding oxidoreductase [Prosthecochloris sp.]NEX12133.1 FAD-binding oxidoreductase [Prosthecochloris sp.]